MNYALFLWLGIAAFFLMLEMAHAGLFFFLSFVFGGAAAALSSMFPTTFYEQSSVFTLITIASFIALQLWVSKKMRPGSRLTNAQALIGKRALVIKRITPEQAGEVKIGGEVWSAKSKKNEIIESDSWVEVIEVRGAHVMVSKIL